MSLYLSMLPAGLRKVPISLRFQSCISAGCINNCISRSFSVEAYDQRSSSSINSINEPNNDSGRIDLKQKYTFPEVSSSFGTERLRQVLNAKIPENETNDFCKSHIVFDRKTLEERAESHRNRLDALLGGDLYKDIEHPIFNFLFKYYSFNKVKLFSYSPGLGVKIENVSDQSRNKINTDNDDVSFLFRSVLSAASPTEDDSSTPYSPYSFLPRDNIGDSNTDILIMKTKPFTKNQHRSLVIARDILKNSYNKFPSYNCFGLHEWAMVYKPSISRSSTIGSMSDEDLHRNYHQGSLKLRVNDEEIARFLESRSLRCTHFDAFRFFSKAAVPMNLIALTGYPGKVVNEQPGCLHVHMDLFKWALKLHPYVPSELVADALEIALLAREVDMRASPYDLYSYRFSSARVKHKDKGGRSERPGGITRDSLTSPSKIPLEIEGLGKNFDPSPIYIETSEGRKAFQRYQEWLYRISQPVRLELIQYYNEVLLDAKTIEN